MEIITWTTERVERLTQLFEEGLPTAEIGRRLGLTKNAVIGKLHRIALAPRGGPQIAPPQRNFFEFAGPSCLWPHGHPDDTGPPASRQALLRRARGARLCAAKGAQRGEGPGRLTGTPPIPVVDKVSHGA
jgi:GcrA cell cycle regulator